MLKNHSFIPSDFARIINSHSQYKSHTNFTNQDLADVEFDKGFKS